MENVMDAIRNLSKHLAAAAIGLSLAVPGALYAQATDIADGPLARTTSTVASDAVETASAIAPTPIFNSPVAFIALALLKRFSSRICDIVLRRFLACEAAPSRFVFFVFDRFLQPFPQRIQNILAPLAFERSQQFRNPIDVSEVVDGSR
mgnify:CR=1 FL=1